jgi:hypothetical protein
MALGLDPPLTEVGTRRSFLGVKPGWRIRPTSLPSVRQLSRKCGILDIHNPTGLHSLLQGYLYSVTFTLNNKEIISDVFMAVF